MNEINTIEDLVEEFDSIMRAGLDEIAVGESDTAEEYFSDANYVLNQIERAGANEDLITELENRYTVNPRNFG